ncbi:MAG: hypothetical protein D6731_14220 [Planctomycetota bacterium]|nr:MAG: hypothetical protein D6731_14220 [Planctomycetota bacterium]
MEQGRLSQPGQEGLEVEFGRLGRRLSEHAQRHGEILLSRSRGPAPERSDALAPSAAPCHPLRMSVQKSREHTFTWMDAEGRVRAVHALWVHSREGGEDRIRLEVVGDGVPIEVHTSVEKLGRVRQPPRP